MFLFGKIAITPTSLWKFDQIMAECYYLTVRVKKEGMIPACDYENRDSLNKISEVYGAD